MANITIYRSSDLYVIEGPNDPFISWIHLPTVGFQEHSTTELTITYDNNVGPQQSWRGLASEVLGLDGLAYGSTNADVFKGLSTGVDVNIQDQTTPPVDTYFLQSVSNFTLLSDVTASTETVLQYDFTASPGHGIIITNEILLLDVVGDRSISAEVLNVVGDVITLDRPIDYAYLAASTLGRITTSQMAVDGSVTPQIYTVRAGGTPADITRMFLTILSGSSMDDGLFGSLPALTRGLVFRVVDGFQKTVFNFKTNQDIRQWCYDVNYATKAPSGQFGLSSRITFAGQHTHGVVLRVSNTSTIQWVVQDNLTGLDSLKISAEGSLTSGE